MNSSEVISTATLTQSIQDSFESGYGLTATLCGTPFAKISNMLEQLGWKPINSRLQLSQKRPIKLLYDSLVAKGCRDFIVFYNCNRPNQKAILATCITEEDSSIILNILDNRGKPCN